jgi:hypothetical protein
MSQTIDLSDVKLLQTLDQCEKYVSLQADMQKNMYSGFFGIVKSRHAGSKINSIDCREDMESNFTVEFSENDMEFSEWRSKPDIDPIMYISALPPPHLRRSQESFKKALSDAVTLSSIVAKLDKICKENIAGSCTNVSTSN